MDKKAFKKPFGNLTKNKNGYFTFIPTNLPPEIDYDESLTALVSEASLQLGNLSGIGKLIPNPHLLISPYIRREAVLSSRIEGTQASILDVFRYEAEGKIDENEKDSKRITEVVNYIRALNECLDAVKNGKNIDIQMIKNAHRILMTGVRGQELNPGEVRDVQNWIGVPGTKIQDATYVPPPPEYIHELLKKLEEFINNTPGRIPVLIQCAMIHYQFEAIHPFKDGNGRIGRLLIPVLLSQRKLLDQPLLYLSVFIEQNKTEYYSLLQNISQNSDWIKWIKFFLHGVITQARDAVDNIQKLITLRKEYEKRLDARKASHSMSKIVDFLFSNPIITVSRAKNYVGITYHSAQNAILSLKEMGILQERGYKQRGRTFIAHEIMAILI
jgi:Fic family protein